MSVVQKTVEYLKKDEIAKNGAIIFISSIIAGIFNYIYQVYMGRVLGPEEYGVFGALFAIFYMIGIISQTLGTSTTQFVSKFVGEGKQIGFFIKGALKRTVLLGSTISIIFLIFSSQLMDILKLSSVVPILILIFILFLTWISPIIDGSLRGLKKFSILSVTNISGAFFKLFFGVLLVMLGLRAGGALMGAALGILFGLVISIFFLKPYIRPNNPHEPDFRFRNFYSNSLPVMVAMISYSVPSNLDVILAKYFFSPLEAGIYNSVAVLGKIIFFFPGAIGTVGFPMIAEKYVRGEDTKDILKKSIIYTGILSGLLVLIYVLFPGIVIKIFGQKYLNAIDFVAPYGMAMFFFSITGVMVNYHLAVRNVRYIALFAGFTVIEIIMLTIFNSSIVEMIEILFMVNLIFLIVSMVYTFGGISTTK
ncbi:Polysaccharide biosynthesis protein [uncultured archaeon]|nr:Polysaccharide biosynthesis protein [uncultured archaeon]